MDCTSRLQRWILFCFVFELSFIAGGKAQFFSHFNLESGLSRFRNEQQYLLFRPRLELGQTVTNAPVRLKWLTAYQPEIFDMDASLLTQRLKGQFTLQVQKKGFSAEMRFRTRYQHFKLKTASYAWQSSDLSFQLTYQASRSLLWSAAAMLWYRDTKDFDRQQLNARVLQLGPGFWLQSFLLRVLLYHERYSLQPVAVDSLQPNHGQRLGLAFGLDRKGRFLFSFHYAILLHFHQGLIRPLTDQQFNLLFGAWLGRHWSLLFFAEYYRLPAARVKSAFVLLYSPVNSTNRLHLKISRDLSRKTELYIRLGYEQEKLIRPEDRWQYGQVVLGFMKKLGKK